MEWVAFIIAVGALALAVLAFKRTGGLAEMKTKVDALSSLGLTEMKKQVEYLSPLGESLRKKTADVLDRLEKRVRGEEKKEQSDSIRKEEVGVKKGEGENG